MNPKVNPQYVEKTNKSMLLRNNVNMLYPIGWSIIGVY